MDVFENNGSIITLPIAFSNTCYVITHCPAETYDGNGYCVGILEHKFERNMTRFKAHGWNVKGTLLIYSNWLAIGY